MCEQNLIFLLLCFGVQVGVFSSYDSPEYEAYTKLTAKLRASYSFAHTLDATLLPKQDAEVAVPGIRLFKDFDGAYLDAPVRAAGVGEWIGRSHGNGLCRR